MTTDDRDEGSALAAIGAALKGAPQDYTRGTIPRAVLRLSRPMGS